MLLIMSRPHMYRVALLALSLVMVLLEVGAPVRTNAQSTPVATPETVAVHGIDVADMDLAVSPRIDFYQFANGGWLERTSIPADRTQVSTLSLLTDQTISQQIELLRDAAGPNGAAAGSDEAKAAAIFTQGLEMQVRDRQGIAPIQDALERIAAIDSAEAYHAYLPYGLFDGVGATLPLEVQPDPKDSSTNALILGEPSLGLPNRDYYLANDSSYDDVRKAYVATNTRFLTAAGYDPDEAATTAQAVYEFEKALAAASLTREQQQQDFSLQYNPRTVEELAAHYPAMDWPTYLAEVGVPGVDHIIVLDTGYLQSLPDIMAKTPVETLRAYLMLELVTAWADALDTELGDIAFAFDHVLTGLEQQPKLEERVLDQVNGALPDAVGKLYVAEHFPPEAKAAIEVLAHDVLGAFGERLATNTWMTPETKAKAVAKLAAVTVQVGYPDTWKTYEAVELADSYARSLRSALAANLRRDFAKAGQPVDRGEWDFPAQIVNAEYNPFLNAIVFPAGILQPPMFDYKADPAANYGAIGFVIGHEITHGFDLSGSQFDAEGNLTNWWTDEDRKHFLALNSELEKQYSAIEVAPGLFVNGQITVGENAADLGGIQNAYAALQDRLRAEGDNRATPQASGAVVVEPPFSPEQRFYIAAASVWRNKTRPALLALLVHSDVHAPGIVRATQPLRNAAPFFTAFGIESGDPMWLSPDDRIVIW
jgi:putative endopeptidase